MLISNQVKGVKMIHNQIVIDTDDLAIYRPEVAIIIGVLKTGNKTLEELEEYTFFSKQAIARYINQNIPDLFVKTKKIRFLNENQTKWRVLTEYSYIKKGE